MKKLELNQRYSREEIHDIFSPGTKFTVGAGTWGIHGIIKMPNRENDFVFIVTYGQSQGEHEFDEKIENGVLYWQSQPKMGFDHEVIKKLIGHNELLNNIYFFRREDENSDYEYLGRLKYLSHDNTREYPVYFQWQLIDSQDFEISEEKLGLKEEVAINDSSQQIVLTETSKPDVKKRIGTAKNTFKSRKSPDYAAIDSRNRKLGLIGEQYVIDYEKNKLIEAGYPDLAENVFHTADKEGDGAGYDIMSFNEDGSLKFIEVKTTRGSKNTDFFMSPNELSFSEAHSEQYYLYRLYDLDAKNKTAEFYILKGNIMDLCSTEPTQYKVSIK